MIKKILFSIVFLLSFHFLFSMEVETRYYNEGQTKQDVKNAFSNMKKIYKDHHYNSGEAYRFSDDNITMEYGYESDGRAVSLIVRYQFYEDRLTITILSTIFRGKNLNTVAITNTTTDPTHLRLYNNLRAVFFDYFFKELKITDNKNPLNKDS